MTRSRIFYFSLIMVGLQLMLLTYSFTEVGQEIFIEGGFKQSGAWTVQALMFLTIFKTSLMAWLYGDKIKWVPTNS